MSKLLDIPVAEIVLSGLNPRAEVHKKNGSLADLVGSIKQFGVRVPIMVRSLDKGYELLAGERRLFASKELKLEDIPAIVYDKMDDVTAFETTMLENEARLGLTVMEQVTQIGTLLDKYQGDIKAVADRLGITAHAVRLRVNAVKLTKKWKKKLADEGDGGLTAEHIAVIARLPVKVQDHFFGQCDREWDNPLLEDGEGVKVITVAELKKHLNEQYLRYLSMASWDLSSKVGGKGACSSCKKRTDCQGQTELWHDDTEKDADTHAQCLDEECWKEKVNATVDKNLAEAKKEHAGLILAISEYVEYGTLGELRKKHGTISDLREYDSPYKDCEEGTKNALPVFIIRGKNAGQVQWMKKVDKSGKQKPVGKNGKPKGKTLAERKKDHHGLRMKLMCERLRAAIKECDEPVDASLEFAAAAAAMYGTYDCLSWAKECSGDMTRDEIVIALRKGKKFDVMIDHESYTVDLAGAIWLKARGRFADVIPVSPNGEQAAKSEDDCKAVAKLIAFDWDKNWAEVVVEKPDPKIWAKLKADGTPK